MVSSKAISFKVKDDKRILGRGHCLVSPFNVHLHSLEHGHLLLEIKGHRMVLRNKAPTKMLAPILSLGPLPLYEPFLESTY